MPEQALQEVAQQMVTAENVPSAQNTSVILCSDYKIRKLNAQYRGINKATDVLSFCFNDPDFLGEIYISLQRADIQSRRYGVTYEQEVRRLFVHGFLHLLGYCHYVADEREIMETKERRYLGDSF